jgi:hypothetical protein
MSKSILAMNYKVIRFDDEGNQQVLGTYYTEDSADCACDMFCEKYPNSYVDVVPMV